MHHGPDHDLDHDLDNDFDNDLDHDRGHDLDNDPNQKLLKFVITRWIILIVLKNMTEQKKIEINTFSHAEGMSVKIYNVM